MFFRKKPQPKMPAILFASLSIFLSIFFSCEVRKQQFAQEEQETKVEITPKTPPISLPSTEKIEDDAPLTLSSPSLGKETAKVTIISFSDFQCPFCAKAAKTIRTLQKTYGSDLRIVWKDFPLAFHQNALPAAIAARALFKQSTIKFFAFHDILFAKQVELNSTSPWKPAEFERFIAPLSGIDIVQWRKDIVDPLVEASVKADEALGKHFGVTGTPTFFINGERVTGALNMSQFTAIIERQLLRANDLLATGVSEKELYNELIKFGIEGPVNKTTLKTLPKEAIFKIPLETK